MKDLLVPLLAGILLACPAVGSHLGLVTVKQPLFFIDAETDAEILIGDVHVISFAPDPEVRYSSISVPFIPPTDSTVKGGGRDVNLASLYGIEVSVDVTAAEGASHWIVTVDASAAKVPEGYPFTIEQVMEAVITCAKLMTPITPESERKISWKVRKPGDKAETESSRESKSN